MIVLCKDLKREARVQVDFQPVSHQKQQAVQPVASQQRAVYGHQPVRQPVVHQWQLLGADFQHLLDDFQHHFQHVKAAEHWATQQRAVYGHQPVPQPVVHQWQLLGADFQHLFDDFQHHFQHLLQQLHSENLLGYRFPIGLEEQIHKWDVDLIRKFHERWYFPANATLYVVGDIASVDKTIEQIEAAFGKVAPGYHSLPVEKPPVMAGPASHLQMPKLQSFLIGAGIVEPPAAISMPPPVRKERHALRPPVKHEWSLPRHGEERKPHIFQHELLQTFSLSLFCKTPVQKVITYADLRDVLMKRIMLSTLQFRINNRYKV
ncbi:hypothetical protein L7F22_057555 [Adiantum nelumboides]|nr:hypothetical protein [Adiantum nelumboides]